MTSMKKLIAVLAVTLPLAGKAQAPAAPPAPLYQIYGTLNLNTQYIEVNKPTAPTGVSMGGRMALSTDSSNVGIRGTADTGQYGLGVVYQCETAANLDGDGAAVLFCGRNSRIGLTGGFGTLFYGNWDTPYKALTYGTKADDPMGNTDVYDAAAIIGSPGAKTRSSGGRSVGGTTANTLASFNQRAGNSIAWHSPKFQGLQVKAQYSMNEYQDAAGKFAPALYSVGANYDRGPLSVAVGYERHDDYVQFTTGAPVVPSKTTHDQGVKGGVGFELGSSAGTTTIGGTVEWLSYNVDNVVAGQFESASRVAYQVGLKHRTGNHELRLRFSQAMDADVSVKGVSVSPNPGKDTGAMDYAVGYAYYLSKAAQVYVYGTKIDNKKAASYTFASSGPASLTSVDWGVGADPFAAGLGLRYAF